MKKVIGYTRVSTNKQSEKGYSMKSQKIQIEDFCKRNDLILVGVLTDGGVSGSNNKQSTNYQHDTRHRRYPSDSNISTNRSSTSTAHQQSQDTTTQTTTRTNKNTKTAGATTRTQATTETTTAPTATNSSRNSYRTR